MGSLCGLAALAAVSAVLLPLRSSLNIATVALILVVPVVLGVVIGGVRAGIVSVAAGFLTFDFVFIPPYYTLAVGAGQNWAALAVYAVVMLLVAQVVSRLQDARARERRRADQARRLLEFSDLLLTDRPSGDLLQVVADAARRLFGVEGTALLLPRGDGLEVAAEAGDPLSASELRELQPESGVPVATGVSRRHPAGTVQAISLTAAGRPVGILAVRGLAEGTYDDLFRTFVNNAALAIEREELRDQALKSQLLEQGDLLRRALLGAVSHDLRTPLATMKVASTSLIDSEAELAPEERRELYGLINSQTDRLDRLVSGLLDMNRYHSGALDLHVVAAPVGELIEDALSALRPFASGRAVEVNVAAEIPAVSADRVLITQVLVNLLDNADRHAPPSSPLTVEASVGGRGRVRISVTDQGPGVPEAEHEAVFESFFRSDSGGRAGLGLWISRTFVEAHGERIWVDDQPGGGASFRFTLRTG